MTRYWWSIAFAAACVLSLIGGVVLTYASVLVPRRVELSAQLKPSQTRLALSNVRLAQQWTDTVEIVRSTEVVTSAATRDSTEGRVTVLVLDAKVESHAQADALSALESLIKSNAPNRVYLTSSSTHREGSGEDLRASARYQYWENFVGRSVAVDVNAAGYPGGLYVVISVLDEN